MAAYDDRLRWRDRDDLLDLDDGLGLSDADYYLNVDDPTDGQSELGDDRLATARWLDPVTTLILVACYAVFWTGWHL